MRSLSASASFWPRSTRPRAAAPSPAPGHSPGRPACRGGWIPRCDVVPSPLDLGRCQAGVERDEDGVQQAAGDECLEERGGQPDAPVREFFIASSRFPLISAVLLPDLGRRRCSHEPMPTFSTANPFYREVSPLCRTGSKGSRCHRAEVVVFGRPGTGTGAPRSARAPRKGQPSSGRQNRCAGSGIGPPGRPQRHRDLGS
ncbi:MAG: hypothetical protein JWM01_3003 [Arthrobacter sp.]|nr:hypothetical protein [Arthrobacter sp.]